MPSKRIPTQQYRKVLLFQLKQLLHTLLFAIIANLPLVPVADASPDEETLNNKQILLEKMSVYIDETSNAALEDILAKEDHFRPLERPVIATPANATTWISFSLDNMTSAVQERILSIVDHVSLHNRLWLKEGSAWKLIGDINYLDWREYPSKPSPTPYFLLDIPKGHNELLISVTNRAFQNIQIELWQTSAFWKRVFDDTTLYAFFIALCIAMATYNLALYSSMNDSMYLYYAGYIFFGCMFFPLRDQIYSIWFDTNLLGFIGVGGNEIVLPLIITVAMLMLALYSFRFLDLSFNTGRQKALKYVILSLPIFFSLFEMTQLLVNNNVQASQFMRMATTSSVLCFGLVMISVITYSATTGPSRVRGRWLMVTQGIALIGAILEALRLLGYLSDSFRFALHTGVAIEILMLSIYMQHRIDQLRREKERAHHALMESTVREAEKLEKVVKERTQELDLKVDELAASNTAKDKFFSLLSHDLRGPIGNLSIMLDMARNKQIHLDDEVLNELYESSNTTFKLLEDLLTWARSHKGSLVVSPQHFSVFQTVTSATMQLEKQARKKGIEFIFNIDENLQGYADADMIGTVVRNLVSNAIKFTRSQGTVTISAYKKDNAALIKVEDTGIGFNEEKGKKLFSVEQMGVSMPGTNREKGTGIGLIICKELAETNSGKIGFHSVPGKGSEFWITLPMEDIKETYAQEGIQNQRISIGAIDQPG